MRRSTLSVLHLYSLDLLAVPCGIALVRGVWVAPGLLYALGWTWWEPN